MRLTLEETISLEARREVQAALRRINQLDKVEVFHCHFEKYGKIFINWTIASVATKEEQHNNSIQNSSIMKLLTAIQGLLRPAIEKQFNLVKNFEAEFKNNKEKYKIEFRLTTLWQAVCPETYIEEIEELHKPVTLLNKPIQVRCDRLSL